MCLIVRGKVDSLYNLDLGDAARCNGDGFGIHFGESVLYSFDFPGFDIWDVLDRVPINATATIHFRFATHGTVNRENCHPFALGDGTFLMHNGILRDVLFQDKVGKKSDTAMLAELLQPLDRKGRSGVLSKYAVGNRFCLLYGKRWRKFGHWYFDDKFGTWHSNTQILPDSRRNRGAYDPRSWGTAKGTSSRVCGFDSSDPFAWSDDGQYADDMRWASQRWEDDLDDVGDDDTLFYTPRVKSAKVTKPKGTKN
jgi:hypothetical protein